MLKKLGIVDLILAIKTKVESATGLTCYDEPPGNAESPFYYVQLVGKRAENTKSMFCEVFTVFIHVISEADSKNTRIYELIGLLDEALTEEIVLPDEFEIVRQENQGIQKIMKDETAEKHAVLSYEFKICYGFKTKS